MLDIGICSFIDRDASGGMRNVDNHVPILDVFVSDKSLDVVCDVDEFTSSLGGDVEFSHRMIHGEVGI